MRSVRARRAESGGHPSQRRPWFDPTVEQRGLGAVVGCVVLVLLVPALQFLHGATGSLGLSIPLFFLVPVLLASSLGGREVGALVGILGVLTWDWFFIPPLYKITIYEPRDVVALVVFLAVGLLTGQLASMARASAREAELRAESAEALHRLSSALLARQDPSAVLGTLTEELRDTFGLQAAAVLLRPTDDALWQTAAITGDLPERLRIETNRSIHGVVSGMEIRPQVIDLPNERLQLLPLEVGHGRIAVLELLLRSATHLDDESRSLILTFANGAALTIEQARLAQEEQAAALARESDRLKSVLLSSVSHDLRTPLAGIKAAASSLLQTDVQWNEDDRRAFLQDIDTESDRLTRLVTNLLDLSRIEAGALRPDADWEDVTELVERVVRRLGATSHDHVVEVHSAPDLPALRLDAVQIEQVLANLIENAWKYSPPGTVVDVSARLDLSPTGAPEVRLSVGDCGPGIPLKERTHIFDKFYRLSSASVRVSGTGMGLAIVKGLVDAHGGRVWVDERPGGGSMFTVALPVPDDAALPCSDETVESMATSS